MQLTELHGLPYIFLFMFIDSYGELLHLLKVGILDGLVGVAALLTASLLSAVESRTCLLTTSLAVHLCTGSLHHCVQIGNGTVDSGNVLILVGILQLLYGSLYVSLVTSQFVTVLVQEGFSLRSFLSASALASASAFMRSISA